ncbi:hypothetical protein DL93DRAFT_294274 [Clavulina sp. PMI_390]|nr:hypothetical protein DL93DRAFT_294274 [Clavulina sp. PMI_390]
MSFEKLPTELILDIFYWVIETLASSSRTLKKDLRSSYDVLTTLAAVNRSWHRIVSSSCQLWGTIVLGYSHVEHAVAIQNRRLERCLIRSMNSPLSLYFAFGGGTFDKAASVVALLCSHDAFHRCRSLTVKATLEKDIKAFLPLPSDISQLRILDLRFSTYNGGQKRALIQPAVSLTSDEPPAPTLQLQKLSLTGGAGYTFDPLKETYLTVERLRHLTLATQEERLPLMMHFLETCYVLETLKITIKTVCSTLLPPAKPFLLPSLNSLTVTEDAGVSFRFMRVIIAPKLRSLQYICSSRRLAVDGDASGKWLDVNEAQLSTIPLFPDLRSISFVGAYTTVLEARILPFLRKNQSTELLELKRTSLFGVILQNLSNVNTGSVHRDPPPTVDFKVRWLNHSSPTLSVNDKQDAFLAVLALDSTSCAAQPQVPAYTLPPTHEFKGGRNSWLRPNPRPRFRGHPSGVGRKTRPKDAPGCP